ncbi:hypothetical protein [Pseudonocardia hydrocarbonoxydans]|uniref:DUF1871 domain-containing protein n=1 Tax=Pseudonocardia hydrocarbonoxydans TaxID=76726 RepID=A0A4Y3WM61_9PSEU|nr:hypothetical protein [Pseudonocardia hydrocarbonoxydans]GEC19923.1 hypothetical protein PHY01_22060 [Pseudonocardia hydrocarbonoxydans]
MQSPAGSAVRDVLNAWNPIGVIEHGVPADEYDCLIAPLLRRLAAGADAAGIAAFLRAELAGHFGLDPDPLDPDPDPLGVDAVATRLAALGR